MDLLGDRPILSLSDEDWRIYSRHGAAGPQFVGADATVINSSITAGCEILGEVRNSVLGPNVRVGKGAVVADSVIMANVTIEDGATIHYAILDENVTVGKNATVGESRDTASEVAVIGADVSVSAGSVVPAGAMICENV